MSKPGGKPIVKERYFFEDDYFAICGTLNDGKITCWVFVDKINETRKEFPVKNNLIKAAFQELEKYADKITHGLLAKTRAKIKGPTAPKVRRSNNGQYKRKRL